MKKYRVKVKCPDFSLGQIVDSHPMCFGAKISCSSYPEIFEEIKEPLFVTEDGVELFEGDHIFPFKIKEFEIRPDFIISNNTDEINLSGMKKNVEQNKVIYFSSKAAAEKWIAENKPVFSKAHILSAIDGCLLMTSSNRISVSELKNILGLNNP